MEDGNLHQLPAVDIKKYINILFTLKNCKFCFFVYRFMKLTFRNQLQYKFLLNNEKCSNKDKNKKTT